MGQSDPEFHNAPVLSANAIERPQSIFIHMYLYREQETPVRPV